MVQAARGINNILLYRLLKDQSTVAFKTAFQTEHSITETSDTDSTATKDGSVQTPGADEVEISVTSILAVDDTYIKKLRDARRNKEVVEIWDIDKNAKPTGNKYPATYYQGYVTEYEKSATAEDLVEISLTIAVNGVGQDGQATLTAEQSEVVQYQFTDTTAQTGK